MAERWALFAALAIAAVTAARVVALALDGTDLFVDETQYWLWGQSLDWGYYSKPPLIAWVLRAITDLAGSDDAFWIRLAAPLFHGATAALLYLVGRRLGGARAGFWTVLAYLSLPIVAVGSWQISTDTILAPSYAAALLALLHLIDRPRPGLAVLTGALVGAAFMAKYAGIYFLICLAIGAALVPRLRIGWRPAALLVLGFGVVVAPNVIWNLANDLTTVSHTMDNADWVDDANPLGSLNVVRAILFLASQIAVFGPVLAAGLVILGTRHRTEDQTALLAFTWPIIGLVTAQALLSGAYANWAFPAFLAATPLVATWMAIRAPRWLAAGIALNAAFAIVFALLYIAPGAVAPGGTPVAARYLGRADFSRTALDFARDTGADAIVAENRDILADLLHTGRRDEVAVYSLTQDGPPRHFYDQAYPYRPGAGDRVVWIARDLPVGCPRYAVRTPGTGGTAYETRGYALHLTRGSCLASALGGD